VLQLPLDVQPSPSLQAPPCGHSEASIHALAPLQVASHAHASPHRMCLHDPDPEQLIQQCCVPHRTSSAQLPMPEHSMTQSDAIRQSTRC